MSKSYRAIFLHVIFQIRKNHPFLLALRKQRKYSSKNFNSFFFFNCYQREISFPFGSRSIFPGNRTTNHRRRRRFGGITVSLKARDQPTQLARFQLSFADFGRGTRESGSGVYFSCANRVGRGRDISCSDESIVRHRSRLVRRSNEILTRPIPTCHSPSREPTFFPCNLHEDFVSFHVAPASDG